MNIINEAVLRDGSKYLWRFLQKWKKKQMKMLAIAVTVAR